MKRHVIVKPKPQLKPKSKRLPVPNQSSQETSWKHIPETSREFCNYWKNHKISSKERKRLFDLLHKRSLELGFDEDLSL